jgi:FKBP-type peptidyl-prolyl cis-trans isomerase 2
MTIKVGDQVELHYTAKFDDGRSFDSSRPGAPIRFTVGKGEVISGVDQGVIGLKEGETKQIKITPEQGYGPHEDELVKRVPKEVIGDQTFFEGEIIRLQTSQGQIVPAEVKKVGKQSVTIDFNHPLAGKVLVFDVEIVGVKPKGSDQ